MTLGRPKLGRVGNARAFSIIESLLAFVVLLIAILGLVASGAVGTSALGGSSPFAFGNIKNGADEIQAHAAAQQYMDALRDCVRTNGPNYASCASAPTVSVDAGYSFISGANLGNSGSFSFNSSGNACTQNNGTTVFTCTVTVTWNEQGTTKTITIASYATDQSS